MTWKTFTTRMIWVTTEPIGPTSLPAALTLLRPYKTKSVVLVSCRRTRNPLREAASQASKGDCGHVWDEGLSRGPHLSLLPHLIPAVRGSFSRHRLTFPVGIPAEVLQGLPRAAAGARQTHAQPATTYLTVVHRPERKEREDYGTSRELATRGPSPGINRRGNPQPVHAASGNKKTRVSCPNRLLAAGLMLVVAGGPDLRLGGP